jgi:hypothetical protein
LQVPSTNRDSLIEPIGLKLVEELYFDNDGRLIESRCISCLVQSHGEPPYVDHVQQFKYEGGFLKKYKVLAFDTISYEVQYLDNKSVTNGYQDNTLGYTSIEYYDSIGRPFKRIEFDFFHTYQSEDNFEQVTLTKNVYEYDARTIYKQSFRGLKYLPLSIEQFAVLETDYFWEIERLADLYELESIGTEVITFSKTGYINNRKMHNTIFPDETDYESSEAGMLESKIRTSNGHKSISEYRFKEW